MGFVGNRSSSDSWYFNFDLVGEGLIKYIVFSSSFRVICVPIKEKKHFSISKLVCC